MGVEGSFTFFIGAGGNDNICMYGTITGLEPNLMSFLVDENSTDCTDTNGKWARVYAVDWSVGCYIVTLAHLLL